MWTMYFPVRRDMWIGLIYRRNNSVFEWTNGERVLYTNWAPGEPDLKKEDGNCVQIHYRADNDTVS